MADLFATHDRAKVERELRRLERHCCRRDTFIDALDYSALDLQTQRKIIRLDRHLGEQLIFGHLYLMHLDDMTTLKENLDRTRRVAA